MVEYNVKKYASQIKDHYLLSLVGRLGLNLMATQNPEALGPRIDIQLSFDRSTHSYSQSEPPQIRLKVTSRAEHAITFFTWREPLDPKGALTNNGYMITDLTTGQEVKTTGGIQINRAPLRRVRGDYDERFFLTLEPDTPVELSTWFGRGNTKPDLRAIVERGRERDEHGNELTARRSTQATGVDGLEPGHQYSVTLNMEGLRSCLWAPVSKDEILVDHRGEGSQVYDYAWNREMSPDFHVNSALLNVLE
ncbi:uncharacterized protein F4822DRAFT_360463 [Hypoxylon trugodes]|uniref:uncharacterized protein n=1 Tax=Hypoxylon trugodes TaxID=326681 RepID=UPI00219046E6|nr:uncharacterized protein F4822DRAFT_360463 [Hypoxylon trugodes]KAI1386019.1 hypothetical protein F4822DRAFT_360463 [Hypoxylon trugodes]